MKGLFIDASVTELKKNYLAIAKFFKSKQVDFEAVFLNVDTASNIVQAMEDGASKAIVDAGIEIRKFTSFNRNKITCELKAISPDFVLIDAMNVSNQVWNIICNLNAVCVYLYPHGFQIDNLFYNKSELINKIWKVMRYTYGIYNISKLIHRPFMKVYDAYSQYIRNGACLDNTAMDHRLMYPKKVFIYSEYYKDFWKRKYGIKDVEYEYIMPFDFTMIPGVLAEPKENALCYITQTLHEDGRYTKEEYIELLKSYIPLAESVGRFYVKLHPRVDSTMYDEIFGSIPSVKIVRDFPHCSCYLTHYSSMAYTGMVVSGNVIIHELPGQPTHEVYQEVASKITYSVEETIAAAKELMTREVSFETRKQNISKYATYSGVSPFEVLYKAIILNNK